MVAEIECGAYGKDRDLSAVARAFSIIFAARHYRWKTTKAGARPAF